MFYREKSLAGAAFVLMTGLLPRIRFRLLNHSGNTAQKGEQLYEYVNRKHYEKQFRGVAQ